MLLLGSVGNDIHYRGSAAGDGPILMVTYGLVIGNGTPIIVNQPTNQIANIGATAEFDVTASGSQPLIYQWYFNGTNLTDNGQITGSQSNVLTLTSVTMGNAGTYQVVVTNAYGSTNAAAILTVQAIPIITWNNPAPILYGTALSSNQLNATANVPGSFAYSPPTGTVLSAGTNTLSLIFTPTDSVDYSRQPTV